MKRQTSEKEEDGYGWSDGEEDKDRYDASEAYNPADDIISNTQSRVRHYLSLNLVGSLCCVSS